MLSIKTIEKWLEDIEENKDDCEIAHGMQDGLNEDFIEHVAEVDKGLLGRKAKMVLRSRDIDFLKYYA